MNDKIDISKYQIRTDLMLESIKDDNKIAKKVSYEKNIKITEIELKNNEGKSINKKDGLYITIEYDDVTDTTSFEDVKSVFIKELNKLIKRNDIKEDATSLIIGLGNSNSTPDSLGPMVSSKVLVTRYLYLLNEVSYGYRNVSSFAPGVMGNTGIESSDLIKCLIDTIKPDFLIVVDALASNSIERLNKTIQMTDTGIAPGSGVGNKRKEISKEIYNIPVIAIGVPTVIEAVTVVADTINYMYTHIKYLKKNMNNMKNKLITSPNYLKEDVNNVTIDKKDLFGLIGDLSDEEFRSLIFDVLTPVGYNLMVTTKEIDFILEKVSDLIAKGIDETLHFKLNKKI